MDHELYKQRQEFMKRATENVAKSSNTKITTVNHRDIPSTSAAIKIKKSSSINEFKQAPVASTTTSKFAIQTKFLKYMKERHLQGDDHHLTVDEALDEMNERNTPINVKLWLVEEALPKNPKIEIVNNRFRFKPLYNIKNRRELRNLLEEQFMSGNGNILLNDLKECYPEAERHVNRLGDQIHKFVRATDKEVIVGLNPNFSNIEALAEKDRFRQIFHSINVDNLPLRKMEEFLQNHDFTVVNGGMIQLGSSSGSVVSSSASNSSGIHNQKQLKPPNSGRKRGAHRKSKIRSNAHLESLLLNYDDLVN